MDIRRGSAAQPRLFLGFLPRIEPGVDLVQVPHHATGREEKPSGKFPAAFHLVNCRVRQGNDLVQLRATDSPPHGWDTVTHGF